MKNIQIKKLYYLLILIFVLALSYYFKPKLSIFAQQSSTQQAQAAPTSGLVAFWKFDERSGSTASDSSKNSNTLVLSNGATWTAGKIGGAVYTNGKDNLLRANPASFDFNGDITVATWIKQELTGGNDLQSTLIVSADSSGARKFSAFLDRANKRFCIQTTNIDSCTESNTYTVIGSWFHFALTKSRKTAKVYINGSALNSDLVTENAIGNDIGIGRYTTADSRGCNCSFDEFSGV